MRKTLFRWFMLIAWLISLALPGQASAQVAFEIRINAVEVIERDNDVLLNIYFTVVDTMSGQVVNNARITSSDIKFNELNPPLSYPGSILQPQNSFYIALLLDTSGSMSGAAEQLRSAALAAIKSPPQGSTFAVMVFNEKFDMLQNFLEIQNEGPLERAIEKVKPEANKGTCLYDAVYQTIGELEGAPPGRRAVVLFTDGKDELPNGDPCSSHTYEEVVQYALQPGINTPIHTIGMASPKNVLNAAELKSMAEMTGGLSVIATQDDLEQSFKTIMDALKGQWLSQSSICPPAGDHTVFLQVRMDEGTVLSEQVSFHLNEDCVAPPDPVNFAIQSVEPSAKDGGYVFTINATSPQMVQDVDVRFWNLETGSNVWTLNQPFEVSPEMKIVVPYQGLENGVDYEFRLAARDIDGKLITNADGETQLVVHKIRVEPLVDWQIDSILQTGPSLLVGLTVKKGELIAQWSGWLVNEEINQKVSGSDFLFRADDVENSFTVSVEGVPTGKYKMVVRALDQNGGILSETTYPAVQYTEPKVTLADRIAKIFEALFKNPLILAAVLGILLALVLWLVVSSNRSGTPSLNTGLGSLLSRPKKIPMYQTQLGMARPDLGGTKTVKQKAPKTGKPMLRVVASPDTLVKGVTIHMDHTPYRIGRKECDFNISLDQAISHLHAIINYDQQQKKYIVTDVSRNGVSVNGLKIEPQTPTVLPPGATLGLGPNTTVYFEVK